MELDLSPEKYMNRGVMYGSHGGASWSRQSFSLFILYATCGWGQIITTVAGGGWRAFPTAEIAAIGAPLGTPWKPALDAQGNVYVADNYDNIVVRISPSGTLIVVAGNGNAGFAGDGGPATL